MFSWYKETKPQERRTFWACYSGWALDTYDVQIFSFLIPTLMAVWTIGKSEAGFISTAALLSAALGGWIAGILSDRFGRVRILIFTVLWFSVFGFLAGFTQNYEQLLVVRVIQGLGFGGEWAVGAALMAETINPKHRAKAIGMVQSGFSVGWLGAALVTLAVQSYFDPQISWRIVFWISVLPAAIILILRRGLKDAEVYRRAVEKADEKASLATVFKPKYLRMTLLSSLMVIGVQSAGYAIIVWTPTMLVERGIAKGSMLVTVVIMAIGTFIGFVSTSYFADRFGRRPALLLMSIVSLFATALYTLAPLGPVTLQAAGFVAIGGSIGIFSAVGPLLSELFPTEVRATCMGFSYNLGKTVGAFGISIVGVLAGMMGLAQAIALCSFVSYLVVCLSLLMLPETRGRSLENVSTDAPESKAIDVIA
ncbi:MFS transporter [Ochrobactrum sp. S46]|nr:MFS transporter [Ochrobactrum sp. S45]MBK0046503.1 MFS transporter [Ochrobactrum sp. S46]